MIKLIFSQDERSFRICRAMNLSANKQILPKEEQPSFEEDNKRGRQVKSSNLNGSYIYQTINRSKTPWDDSLISLLAGTCNPTSP